MAECAAESNPTSRVVESCIDEEDEETSHMNLENSEHDCKPSTLVTPQTIQNIVQEDSRLSQSVNFSKLHSGNEIEPNDNSPISDTKADKNVVLRQTAREGKFMLEPGVVDPHPKSDFQSNDNDRHSHEESKPLLVQDSSNKDSEDVNSVQNKVMPQEEFLAMPSYAGTSTDLFPAYHQAAGKLDEQSNTEAACRTTKGQKSFCASYCDVNSEVFPNVNNGHDTHSTVQSHEEPGTLHVLLDHSTGMVAGAPDVVSEREFEQSMVSLLKNTAAENVSFSLSRVTTNSQASGATSDKEFEQSHEALLPNCHWCSLASTGSDISVVADPGTANWKQTVQSICTHHHSNAGFLNIDNLDLVLPHDPVPSHGQTSGERSETPADMVSDKLVQDLKDNLLASIKELVQESDFNSMPENSIISQETSEYVQNGTTPLEESQIESYGNMHIQALSISNQHPVGSDARRQFQAPHQPGSLEHALGINIHDQDGFVNLARGREARVECSASAGSSSLDTVPIWSISPPYHPPSPGPYEQNLQVCVRDNSGFIDLAQARAARREQCLPWSGASNNLDTVSVWRDLPPFYYPSPGCFEQGVQDCVQANSDFIDLAQAREARRERHLPWSGASNSLDVVSVWRDPSPCQLPSPGSFEQGIQDRLQDNNGFIDLAQAREVFRGLRRERHLDNQEPAIGIESQTLNPQEPGPIEQMLGLCVRDSDGYINLGTARAVVEQRSQVEASLNNQQICDFPGVDSDPLQHLVEAIITDEDGFINLSRARAVRQRLHEHFP